MLQKMYESLGFNTVSYDTVKIWFRKRKAGNFDTEDESCSGRPAKVDCDKLKQIINQDRNTSTQTIVLTFDGFQKTIVNVLIRINLALKFNRLIAHELTAEDKSNRIAAGVALLRDQRKEILTRKEF